MKDKTVMEDEDKYFKILIERGDLKQIKAKEALNYHIRAIKRQLKMIKEIFIDTEQYEYGLWSLDGMIQNRALEMKQYYLAHNFSYKDIPEQDETDSQ